MFLCIENKVNAYTDPGVGPHNLRNFYVNYKYVDLKAVSDKNTSVANQLEFTEDNYRLISESTDWAQFSKLKGKKVDVFGISHIGHPNIKYMYGGVTLSDRYLDEPRNIPINLLVKGKHSTISSDKVSTNKKL